MLRGFKNFIMRGSVVEVAVGLVIAFAFTTLVKAFTDSIITPLLTAIGPGGAGHGLGFHVRPSNPATFLDFGAFVSAIVYFIIFMAVIYFAIVVPYKMVQARRGIEAFAEPAPTQTCPACLSSDLPLGASKCKYCGTPQPVQDAPVGTA